MPRTRYQCTDADVPVVYRWVQAKLCTLTWPQPAAAHMAREQFPSDQPTAPQRQQWGAQYLTAPQWAQLQAVIRAARQGTRQTRTIRLSTRAPMLLHALAQREQRTLSATLERHLTSVLATPPPTAPAPDTTGRQHTAKREVCRRYRARRCAVRGASCARTLLWHLCTPHAPSVCEWSGQHCRSGRAPRRAPGA